MVLHPWMGTGVLHQTMQYLGEDGNIEKVLRTRHKMVFFSFQQISRLPPNGPPLKEFNGAYDIIVNARPHHTDST